MDRRNLVGLTRDELVAHARAAGIDGAEWLSREELVAMLSRATGTGRPAGILDRARALIDRARRSLLRPMATPSPAPPPAREPPPRSAPRPGGETGWGEGPQGTDAPVVVPDEGPRAAEGGPEQFETLTMADVYCAQGLPDEARRIAKAILGREPEHAGARALFDRLGEPGLDRDADEEPKAAYDEDIVCLHLVRAEVLYCWWEVTARGRERAQALLGEPGRLVLRLATNAATGPSSVRDEPISDATTGDAFLRDVSPDARHRAAVGLVAESGRFVPVAHSSSVWTPRVGPSPDTRVDWLEVPLGDRSRTASPPSPVRRTAADLPVQARAHRLARESQP